MNPSSESLYFEWPGGVEGSDLKPCPDDLLSADLEEIDRVGALSTTRRGGLGKGDYDSFNLAYHVGDADSTVKINRIRLADLADDDVEFCWLDQVHGTEVVEARRVADANHPVEADACVSKTTNLACTVLTADCLPVLFSNFEGTVVAAAHAGWRGLAEGVLENTVEAMETDPGDIVTWLGPAIGPDVYEVGDDVYRAFIDDDPGADQYFKASPFNPDDRRVADLYGLAERRLKALGIEIVTGGRACTYSDEETFFSYRRDGTTGRMATAIWPR